MTRNRTPFILGAWMFGTRYFAVLFEFLFWILHRRMGADPKRFPERMGRGSPGHAGRVIWFHAASLGEVIQIEALAKHLASSQRTELLVTTTTASGADWVERRLPQAHHRFLPVDTSKAVERFLNSWSICAAVFVEGDLWPRLTATLKDRGIPLVLLNARHSRSRERFPTVFEEILKPFSVVTCRSETVAKGMIELGLPSDRVHVLPDLRLTSPRLPVSVESRVDLARAIDGRPVWLAASTHPADEDVVLAAHEEVISKYPGALLLLAPRHPKRGAALRDQALMRSLEPAQRSLEEALGATTQVYIADTLGELGVFFDLSPVVFLGGSFGQEGGHNPYEPAHFQSAILYGPNVRNFVDGYEALSESGAATQVDDPEALGQTVAGLICSDRAVEMARAGTELMEYTNDATERYAELIASVISSAEVSSTKVPDNSSEV